MTKRKREKAYLVEWSGRFVETYLVYAENGTEAVRLVETGDLADALGYVSPFFIEKHELDRRLRE